MRKYISLLVVGVLLSTSALQVSGYTYTGSVRENGDAYWDSNEITFIDFELDEGELFELSISSADGDLELMVCECNEFEDIQGFMEEMMYEGTVPDKLYLWMDTYEYTSGEMSINKRIDLSVAIFSLNPFNPSTVSFTLETNLPKGDRIDDGIGFLGVVIILAVVGGAIYWYRKRSTSPSISQASSYQYNPGYNSGYSQPQSYSTTGNTQSSTQASFCPNCGSAVSSVFCNQCGERVN